MEISRIRHAWPEKKGFNLYRRNGMDEYTFLHFWKPVYMLVDGETILTKPNAVIIIGKHVPHHFYSPDTDLVHDWFHFDGEDAADFIAASGLKTDTVYYPKNCGFITDIVKTMEGELFGAEKHSEEIMLSYMAILFRLIDRHEDETENDFNIDYQTQVDFKMLRNRIFSNLDKNWTIRHMAEQIILSESRFYVLYKAIFKTTPNQDLIIARMDYAKRLLSQNNTMPIFDVALKCGYSNEFHFIRQFKKHVGITPKKYALLHRGL